MSRRIAILMLVALLTPLVLTACTQKTALRFSNETDCGTATITLSNIETGNLKKYTVDQGKEIEIELEPNVDYQYEVTYLRQSDFMRCDSKTVATMLEKGKALNITLDSVVDPALEEPPSSSTD